MIENAVLDFINTNKLSEKYSVFEVKIYNPLFKKVLNKKAENNYVWENEKPYQNLIALNIFGTERKNHFLINDDKIPSNYIEINNKLFIWNEKDNLPDEKTIQVLKKYGIISKESIDTLKIIDDKKKGTDYFFCKNNLNKFRKVNTNIAIGYYELPKINCE